MSPDLLIAIGQAFCAVNAILMLTKKATHIHPVMSGGTAVSLGLISSGLFMLSAPMSGALTAVCAAAWLGIFFFRGDQR